MKKNLYVTSAFLLLFLTFSSISSVAATDISTNFNYAVEEGDYIIWRTEWSHHETRSDEGGGTINEDDSSQGYFAMEILWMDYQTTSVNIDLRHYKTENTRVNFDEFQEWESEEKQIRVEKTLDGIMGVHEEDPNASEEPNVEPNDDNKDGGPDFMILPMDVDFGILSGYEEDMFMEDPSERMENRTGEFTIWFDEITKTTEFVENTGNRVDFRGQMTIVSHEDRMADGPGYIIGMNITESIEVVIELSEEHVIQYMFFKRTFQSLEYKYSDPTNTTVQKAKSGTGEDSTHMERDGNVDEMNGGDFDIPGYPMVFLIGLTGGAMALLFKKHRK